VPDLFALASLTEAEAANIKALFADEKYGLTCSVLLHKWGNVDDYLAGLDPRQTDRALGRRDIALGLREAVHWTMPRLVAMGRATPSAPGEAAPAVVPRRRAKT
jgi:hypothetical protein